VPDSYYTRGVPFQIVVSAQNTSYMAWQTQLFCFSALSRLGKHPTIVVHDTYAPLRPEFAYLRAHGFKVIEAPSFTKFRKITYAPRNEIGSLLITSSIPKFSAEHILFCEPDMLFVGPLAYPGVVAGEFYRYIDYGSRHVTRAAEKLGLGDAAAALNATSQIGVPYLIPVKDLARLANRWIEAFETFDAPQWIDIMYAFGFALKLEGIEPQTTRIMNDNLKQNEPLTGSIIHYCYGDSVWSKRSYVDRSPLACRWCRLPRTAPGTILDQIVQQMREAKRFFRRGTFLKRLLGTGGTVNVWENDALTRRGPLF